MKVDDKAVQAAIIMARAAVLNARVAGMVAQNQAASLRGEYPYWDRTDFNGEIDASGITEQNISDMLTKGEV